jgi:hypothetical protein
MNSASRRHSLFERDEKILVQFLLFAASLMFKALALLNRVVLLDVAGGNFLAVDAALEDFDGRRHFGQLTNKSVTSGMSTMR